MFFWSQLQTTPSSAQDKEGSQESQGSSQEEAKTVESVRSATKLGKF